jgi:hypothetical protein
VLWIWIPARIAAPRAAAAHRACNLMVDEYYFTAAQIIHFLSLELSLKTYTRLPGRKSKLYGPKTAHTHTDTNRRRQPLKKRLIDDQIAAIWTHLQVRWLDLRHRRGRLQLYYTLRLFVCPLRSLRYVQLNP